MSVIDGWAPPRLLALIRRARGSGRPDREADTSTRAYGSYEEAAALCTGWEQKAVIQAYRQKTVWFRDRLEKSPTVIEDYYARSLLALVASRRGDSLNVVDFGGAFGQMYFLARAFLPTSVRIMWTVIETQAMAAAAATEFGTEELRFVSGLEEARAATERSSHTLDLVYSSGTLPHVPDPYRTLKDLVDFDARFLFLTRLNVAPASADIITIGRRKLSALGPGPLPAGIANIEVTMPITYLVVERLESIIRGPYTIRLVIREHKGSTGYGCLAEKN